MKKHYHDGPLSPLPRFFDSIPSLMTFSRLFLSIICSFLLFGGITNADHAVAVQGTPTIDGDVDAAWKKAAKIKVNKPVPGLMQIGEDEMATATVQILWDDQHLYALWRVRDSELSADASDDWAQDSVEFFLDQDHKGTTEYEADDAQYRVNYLGKQSGQGKGYDPDDVKAAVVETDDGYRVEMSIRVAKVELKPGAKLGLELQLNDDHDSGSRDAVAKWHHTEDNSWQDPSTFGTLELK